MLDLTTFSCRLAVLAFIFDTSSRAYALFQDIREPFTRGSYAPHPYAVALGYALIAVVEVVWMQNMSMSRFGSAKGVEDEEGNAFVKTEENNLSSQLEELDNLIPSSEESSTREFLPLYGIGCLCQANWALAWLTSNYAMCRFFITVSAVTNLYAIFAVLEGSINRGLPRRNVAIHIIAKARAAMAMLLLWKTWGAVNSVPPPSTTQQFNNLAFLLIFALSSGPDPTMGLFLVFVLLSLALGPYKMLPTQATHDGTILGPEINLISTSTGIQTAFSAVHCAFGMVLGGAEGGWHDTFLPSACVVFIAVLVDWLFARRTRKRSGSFRAGNTGAGVSSPATYDGLISSWAPIKQDRWVDADDDGVYGWVSGKNEGFVCDGRTANVRNRRSGEVGLPGGGHRVTFDYPIASLSKKAQRVLGIDNADVVSSFPRGAQSAIDDRKMDSTL